MSSIPIGIIADRIMSHDFVFKEEALNYIRSAEFRAITQRNEQIIKLSNNIPEITRNEFCIIFDISPSTVSRIMNEKIPNKPIDLFKIKVSNSSLLTKNEEKELIEWINHRQEIGDCPTSKEVRQHAEKIQFSRTNQEKAFSRNWWKNFKTRHNDIVSTNILHPIEEARQNVSAESALKYVGNLMKAIQGVKSPKQILNLDETGFPSKPNKSKPKRCVVIRNHKKAPTFREMADANHVSMAAAINLAGESLIPMMITTTNVKLNDGLEDLENDFVWVKTKKGYMTEKAMLFWVQNVLSPYATQLRSELNDINAKIVLIMDNFGCHSCDSVLSEFDKIGSVEIVWLPPHSSHIFQPLDLFPFGQLKKIYFNGTTRKTSPLVNGKILHILQAWHNACFKINIFVGWSRAGIDKTKGDVCVKIDMRTITREILAHCSETECITEWHLDE